MPGKPYLPLYVGDWKKDPRVQSLTYEERGVWMELLMFMHENEDRGKLSINGAPLHNDTIARMLGLSPNETSKILSKLLATGVASQDPKTEIVYNRRMVREEELHLKRVEAGSKGGLAKAKQTSSKVSTKTLASSDIDSDNDIDTEVEVVKDKGDYSTDFEEAWDLYPDREGGNPKKAAFKAWKARIAEDIEPAELIGATARYAEYCDNKGKIGTEFVMQASTFYGPNERWRESYEVQDEEAWAPQLFEEIEPLPEVSEEEREAQLEQIRKLKDMTGEITEGKVITDD